MFGLLSYFLLEYAPHLAGHMTPGSKLAGTLFRLLEIYNHLSLKTEIPPSSPKHFYNVLYLFLQDLIECLYTYVNFI